MTPRRRDAAATPPRRRRDAAATPPRASTRRGRRYDKLCASCLGGYTGEVSYGPLKDYETSENGDPHDSGGKVCPEHVYEDTSTRHPPCAWPAMNCTHGDGCRPDVYARATANVFKHFVWSRRFVAAPRVWAKDNTYAQATANVFKHLARSER